MLGIRGDDHKPIIIENMGIFKLAKKVLIISSYMAICFFAPLSVFILANLDITNARNSNIILISNYIKLFGGLGRMLNTYFSLVSNMFPVTLAFSFIQLSIDHRPSKNRRFLISLLSTFCYVVYILAYVGRDGIVYWIITFVIEYNMFKKYIKGREIKKYLRLPMFSILILMLIIFLHITKARFGSSLADISGAILSYMGQQVKNFSDRYSINPPLSHGRANFPLLMNMLDQLGIRISFTPKSMINAYYFERGLQPWVFATFIGSFLSDFGKLGTILIITLGSIYMRWIINGRSRKAWYLSDLLIILLYCQIVSWGVFYFRQYSDNLYLLCLLALVFILRFSRRIRYSVPLQVQTIHTMLSPTGRPTTETE